jgi:hypothetical protein
MADRGNTEFFEVIGGQRGQDRGIDVIVAECRFILFETKFS